MVPISADFSISLMENKMKIKEDPDCGVLNKENDIENSIHEDNSKSSYSDTDTDEYNQQLEKRSSTPKRVTNVDGLKPRRRIKKSDSNFEEQVNYGGLSAYGIARRNERERHRVKLVNNSFALLRSRIPHLNRKGDVKSLKRLSKVETLRSAVDYIQHLEFLLNINENALASASGDSVDDESSCDQSIYVKTEFIETESDNNQTEDPNYPEFIDVEQMQKFQLSPNSVINDEILNQNDVPAVLLSTFQTGINLPSFVYPAFKPPLCSPTES